MFIVNLKLIFLNFSFIFVWETGNYMNNIWKQNIIGLKHHMHLSEWKTIFYVPSRTDIMDEAYFLFRFPKWTSYMPVNFKLF
jgi:hypothetical protein